MPSYITHAYIAKKQSRSLNYIAGNIFPDIGILINFHFKNYTFSHKNIIEFANFLKKKKYNQRFIHGISDHLKLDNFAHSKIILPWANKMAKKTGLDPDLLHFFFELEVARTVFKQNPKILETVNKSKEIFSKKSMLINYLEEFFKYNILGVIDDGFKILDLGKPSLGNFLKLFLIINHHIKLKKNALKMLPSLLKNFKYLNREARKEIENKKPLELYANLFKKGKKFRSGI